MAIKEILDEIDFAKPVVKTETPEPTKPILSEDWERLLRYTKGVPELNTFLSWLAGLGAELQDGHPRPLGYHCHELKTVKRIILDKTIFPSVLPIEIDIYPKEEEVDGSELFDMELFVKNKK